MSSTPTLVSEYQRDQWLSLTAIGGVLEQIPADHLESLWASLSEYLVFRQELAAFHAQHFHEYCRKACHETGLSACCGFESIITFFADQLISCLLSDPADMEALIRVLERPNTMGNSSSSALMVAGGGCHRFRVPCSIATRQRTPSGGRSPMPPQPSRHYGDARRSSPIRTSQSFSMIWNGAFAEWVCKPHTCITIQAPVWCFSRPGRGSSTNPCASAE